MVRMIRRCWIRPSLSISHLCDHHPGKGEEGERPRREEHGVVVAAQAVRMKLSSEVDILGGLAQYKNCVAMERWRNG
jgi:hypothetical protein